MDGMTRARDRDRAPSAGTRTSCCCLIAASRSRVRKSMRVAIPQRPERRGGGRRFDQGPPVHPYRFRRCRGVKSGVLASVLDRTEGTARRRDHGFGGLKIRRRGIRYRQHKAKPGAKPIEKRPARRPALGQRLFEATHEVSPFMTGGHRTANRFASCTVSKDSAWRATR